MAGRRSDVDLSRGDGKKVRRSKGPNKKLMNKGSFDKAGGDTLDTETFSQQGRPTSFEDSNGNDNNLNGEEKAGGNETESGSGGVVDNQNGNSSSPGEEASMTEESDKSFSLDDESSKETLMVSALQSMESIDSFHSIIASEDAREAEEDEEDEDTTIEDVVNASLIVNLSKTNASINITTSKDVEDPLCSSRSCAPDFHQITASSTPNVNKTSATVTFDERLTIYPESASASEASESLENSMIELMEDKQERVTVDTSDPTTTTRQTPLEMKQSSPAILKVDREESSLRRGGVGGAGRNESHLLEEAEESADEEVTKINSNFLPSTVTELTADNGIKVYLVGTAHFSQQSQMDVMQTIEKVQPTLVLLELCHSRRNILMLDEETILKEAADMSLPKIRSAISQSGAVQGALHLLLLSMSAQLTKKLGMAPGGEFRIAMREAMKIPGCVLLLGDRPFKVTLSRALAALTFTQKCKLAWQFLTSNEDITREEIEKCKEKDLLERMLTDLTGEYPTITTVFVTERDEYLAHSLWLSATSRAHDNKGGPIVGVVGMGHVPGIVKNWGRTTEERICDIVSVPEATRTSRVLGFAFRFGFYSLLGYGAFRLTRRVFDFPTVQQQQSFLQQLDTLKNVFV